LEFEQRFATEEACYKYLANIRWPEGSTAHAAHIEEHGSAKEGFIDEKIVTARFR